MRTELCALLLAIAALCACAAQPPQTQVQPKAQPKEGAKTSAQAVPASPAQPAAKAPKEVLGTPRPAAAERPALPKAPKVVIGVPNVRAKVPASLKKEIEGKGVARVIVEFALPQPFRFDGAPGELAEQDSDIAHARDVAFQNLQRTAQPVRDFPRVPFVSAEIGAAELDALEASQAVISVRRDLPLRPASLASRAHPAALDDAVTLVGATSAHASGWDGEGWAIVIVDVGIDDDHSFLDGARVVGGSSIYGRGAHFGAPGPADVGRSFYASPECHPNHATSMASIAGGANAYGKGIAPHAQFISIRVADDEGVIWCSDVARALLQVWLDWSVTHRIAAVNLSLSAMPDADTLASGDCIDPSPLLALMIEILATEGIPVVAGAGNDDSPTELTFPACFATTIAVGASTKLDEVEGYSNSAAELDLFAPGSGVHVPSEAGFCELKAGTSVSTAFVSGALAILRERWPTRPLAELVDALVTNGPDLTTPDTGLVRHRLAIDKALLALDSTPPPPPPQ